MKIAAELRVKHGTLRQACIENGGVKAFAKTLGVSEHVLGSWVRMQSCPTPGVYANSYTKRVERKLESICGVPAAELFPQALRDVIKLSKTRVYVAVSDMEPAKLLEFRQRERERLEVKPAIEAIMNDELSDALKNVLRTLPYRARQIIEMRYFEGLTLDEVAFKMKVTKERIRQLEMQAVRLLQQPSRAELLIDFVQDSGPSMLSHADEEFDRLKDMSLLELVKSRDLEKH